MHHKFTSKALFNINLLDPGTNSGTPQEESEGGHITQKAQLCEKGDITNFVLVSPDKDMEQIPCRIYNLKQEFTQTAEDAERKLWHQCLTGDSTDGYKGCPGVGPKTADYVLNNREGTYWDACLDAYLEKGQTEEDALKNLRLARILQVTDWDDKKQEPILYTPSCA